MLPVTTFPTTLVWGTSDPRRHSPAHHVVKRAQGGSDFDLDRLVAFHAQTDASYARGRPVITSARRRAPWSVNVGAKVTRTLWSEVKPKSFWPSTSSEVSWM